MQRVFHVYEPLTAENADKIYDHCNEVLSACTAQDLMRGFHVKAICTTDDPCDALHWHKKIADDPSMEIRVLPAFRPDKAVNVEKAGFASYIRKLSEVTGCRIQSAEDVITALGSRIEFFDTCGCLCADHGLDYCMYMQPDSAAADRAFHAAMEGLHPSREDVEAYKTMLLIACGLPKMVLYSLNACENTALVTTACCFQEEGVAGKTQHGSGWWFNDNRSGMRRQITELAENGMLGSFIGMLTDSRSFLSYTRHEYFRRVLCELLGEWVESGWYPEDKGSFRKS